jgi:hypothetical protein
MNKLLLAMLLICGALQGAIASGIQAAPQFGVSDDVGLLSGMTAHHNGIAN